MSDTDTEETVETTEDATVEEQQPETDAWKPPTKADWDATQAKLKKANAQAASHRKEADELKRRGETDTEAAVRSAREEAEKAAEDVWKPRFVRKAAAAALVEAGLNGPADRLLKLIDMDEVEIDEDGELSGLDQQVRSLKKDFPSLFGARGGGAIDGADRGGRASGGKPGLSKASAALLGQLQS